MATSDSGNPLSTMSVRGEGAGGGENRSWTRALWWALLPLLGWWMTGLFDLDEGFYAAVVSEMNRRGDWITPFYNGEPWFEKPILLYWLGKPLVALFGESFGPRLPSVLSALALYGVVGWFFNRRLGSARAIWAVSILGTSLLFVAIGRLMMTDMPFVATLTACLLLFYLSLVETPKWRLPAAALLGLAVLAKGPVAAIFFVGIAGLTFWLIPSLRSGFRGGWLPAIPAFFAVVALWYVPCWMVNGDLFVQKFLIEQNLGRFSGGDQAHTVGFLQGLPIYPITLFVGMLPWSLGFIKALRSPFSDGDSLTSFLKIWFWFVFVFFVIAGAKLPHYILPAAVPLGLLLSRHGAGSPVMPRSGLITSIAMAIIANAALIFYYNQGHAEIHQLAKSLRSTSQGDLPVMVYQMPRRENDRGTGSLHLRETSHPSLVLYLNRTLVEGESLADVQQLSGQGAFWILTRKNRLDLTTLRESLPGRVVTQEFTPSTDYACYLVK